MKKTRVVIIIAAGLVLSFAGLLHAGWIRTYGGEDPDIGYHVQQTSDSGYVITGYTWSFSVGLLDIWLLKTDANGDTLWTKIYGGEGLERAKCVQQTSDGGYIIVGVTGDTIITQNLWLLKTDPEGDTLWTRVYGVHRAEGNFVQETPDGGYIITGKKICIEGDYLSYCWLLKTDASGDTLWTRTYHSEADSGSNWGNCVCQTADGGYILTGGSTPPGGGCSGLSLIKTDSNGDTSWTHLYGGEGSACGTSGKSVQQIPDGGYIVAGSLVLPEAYMEKAIMASWLLKTDEQGETLWTRTYKASADLTTANCLDQTSDGGYILVGKKEDTTGASIWLIKTDGNGDTIWTRTFGKFFSSGNCVHQTPDGGYIITGSLENNVCLIKTDSLGYVSVAEEPPVTPVTYPSNWQISASIGPQITLRYTNHPQGFHASIFDAVGCRVDEIHADESSGIITWPLPVTHQSPGVYFIRLESDTSGSARKVVLMK